MIFDSSMILAFGVTFGIVAMTIVYTAVRYAYSKELIYLTYSIMQIFSFVFIIAYSKLFFDTPFMEELSITFATLFAFAFAIGFYQGDFIPKMQTQKELLLYTLILIFILLTAFYHYMLFEYLPYTVIYFVLFISVAFNFKKGIKPTFIYVVGWSLFCLVLYFTNFKMHYIENGYINIVLVAFAIEAILFTLSVAYKYGALHHENQEFQEQLIHQSRLAQSGEMIANITHQWRQPLNNVSYILMNLKNAYEKKSLSQEYMNKKVEQANSQLLFMSKTMDDFKEFYTPTKLQESFLVKESIQKAITIIQSELQQKNIELHILFEAPESIKIFGISNELSQVLINLLNNAKDALKDIEFPKIIIKVSANSSDVRIEISDNGKGIKRVNKIFEPYYTTKTDGLGIGLYMVKTIIEKSFKAKIEAKNNEEAGATFCLLFEKSI